MRRTGKQHWDSPNKKRIPGAVYVAIVIGSLGSAMAIGLERPKATDETNTTISIETTAAEPTAATEATMTAPSNALLPSLYSSHKAAPKAESAKATIAAVTKQPPVAPKPATQQATAQHPAILKWETLTVKGGDTFSTLMERANFPTQAWFEVVSLGKAAKPLTNLRAGATLKVARDEKQRVAAIDYPINVEDTLQVRRTNNGLAINTHSNPVERRTVSANGTIKSAFYFAAQDAKLPDNITMELADLFAWDINFALDIREGDQFSVLYEEKYQNDKKIGYGHIIAAEFINKGKTYRTIRYTNPEGKSNYYTPDGRSMRRAFLRSPVHFTRISSRFNPNRLHPIYKTKRPHRGVDYAAPRGTPIMSSGDGVVTFAGVKTGYGNVVIIKHGERYSTLYAHMDRIGKGMRRGKRVKQGQTIGTVGATGWATGPHLHYEFRVDGVHRNPLTVKLPLAEPIEKRFRRDFKEHSAPIMAWLDAVTQTQLARNNP